MAAGVVIIKSSEMDLIEDVEIITLKVPNLEY